MIIWSMTVIDQERKQHMGWGRTLTMAVTMLQISSCLQELIDGDNIKPDVTSITIVDKRRG